MKRYWITASFQPWCLRAVEALNADITCLKPVLDAEDSVIDYPEKKWGLLISARSDAGAERIAGRLARLVCALANEAAPRPARVTEAP